MQVFCNFKRYGQNQPWAFLNISSALFSSAVTLAGFKVADLFLLSEMFSYNYNFDVISLTGNMSRIPVVHLSFQHMEEILPDTL